MFLFKLNPIGFNLLLVQQVFCVYCQCHNLSFAKLIVILRFQNFLLLIFQ